MPSPSNESQATAVVLNEVDNAAAIQRNSVREPVEAVFQQSCPTCGRRLLIRFEYLGSEVYCGHCHRALTAQDPAMAVRESTWPSPLDRAETLLASL